MAALLTMMSNIVADEVIVNDVTIPQGGEATLEIELNNTVEYTRFSLDLVLPEGITVTGQTLGERFATSDHTIRRGTWPDWYRFIGDTENSMVIPGTCGTLVAVTLKTDETLPVGCSYQGILTGYNQDNGEEIGMEFTTPTDEPVLISRVTFTITIGEPGDGRIILDENSTTMPTVATDVDVRVLRTINANEWSTIVLPFAMTETQVKAAFGDDVQLADFTGYDVTEAGEDIVGITVGFDDVTAIEANHPYIIKVGTDVTEFTVDGVNVEPIDAPCVAFGREYGRPKKYHPMDFIGTYVADFDFFNDAQSRAIFLSGGKFYYATASTGHMKAFRAYFDFDDILTDVEQAANVIEFKINSDDDATGLKNLNDLLGSNVPAYNLSGQRVGKNYKGIVVTKGKKAFK